MEPKTECELGILKKIDRVMCNLEFTSVYPGSHAIFQPYHISDHAPAVLKVYNVSNDKPRPFKFLNFLAYKHEFMKVMEENWNVNVHEHNMFKLVNKMKFLKRRFVS